MPSEPPTPSESRLVRGPSADGSKYDTSLLSDGWRRVRAERQAESHCRAQARAMLGLEGDAATPEKVIHAILQMDVDLLWNGGIGTYVKASWETHAEADDRSNNAVRISAPQLRAKIVGEGGNLGLTGAARIEAGLRGVRLNTDAIDNSGGVDMSDHEVNLKILLNGIVKRGALTESQRNHLLEDMTEEVAGLVLANNDRNGRQLSRDELRSEQNIYQFGRAIAFVERVFERDRTTMGLPSEEELTDRATRGVGLARPELAALSAWVKMYVSQELMAGDPKRLPGYRTLLHTYFPARVRAAYPDDIDQHMLADEIAITEATTRMVTDAGAAFFPLMIETTGSSVQDIADAYLKAQQLANAEAVRGALEELRTTVSLAALYRAWVEVDAGTQEVALYWLSARGTIPGIELLEEMRNAAQQVYELQASSVLKRNRDKFDELLSHDVPEDVARRVLRAQYLNVALTVWSESKRTGRRFEEIAVQHLAIGRATRLQEVIEDLAHRPAEGRWEPIALRILHGRFSTLLRNLVVKLPNWTSDTVDQLAPSLASGPLASVRTQVDEMLDADVSPSPSTLLVLEERIAAAIARID